MKDKIHTMQIIIFIYIMIHPLSIRNWIKSIKERNKGFTREELNEIEKPRTSAYQIKLSEIKPKSSLDEYTSYYNEISV